MIDDRLPPPPHSHAQTTRPQVITKLPQPFYGLCLLPIGLLLVDGGQIQSMVKDAFDRLKKSSPSSLLSLSPPSSPTPADQRAKMAALGKKKGKRKTYCCCPSPVFTRHTLHSPYPSSFPFSPTGLNPFQIEFFSAALPVLIERVNLLPAPCLEWRLLQWLGAGSEMVEPQLHR